MIHANSAAAFAAMVYQGALQPLECKVLNALQAFPDSTRESLTVDTGMALSSVCGRIRSLLYKGAIYESGSLVNPTTGKKNATLRIEYANRK